MYGTKSNEYRSAEGVRIGALRLYIAVSTRLYREGLMHALGASEQLYVLGASGTISTIVSDVEALRPDIVLVDVGTRSLFSAISKIRHANPDARIVALSVPDAPASALACAEAGVSGYVTRDGSIADLTRVILSANAGEFECSPMVAAALVARLVEKKRDAKERKNLSCLTMRELEVIRLLEHGLSNKAIAQDLGIKLPTVKNHVHNIFEKLHVKARCEAAALFRRMTQRP